MKKCKAGILIFFLLIFLVSSCTKFEEGPFFSFTSVDKRLTRDWKIEYSVNLENGINHSADYDGWLLSIHNDGNFTKKVIYNQLEYTYQGKWERITKNQIKFSYNSPGNDYVEFYTILRLSKNELWLIDSYEEIHYYAE